MRRRPPNGISLGRRRAGVGRGFEAVSFASRQLSRMISRTGRETEIRASNATPDLLLLHPSWACTGHASSARWLPQACLAPGQTGILSFRESRGWKTLALCFAVTVRGQGARWTNSPPWPGDFQINCHNGRLRMDTWNSPTRSSAQDLTCCAKRDATGFSRCRECCSRQCTPKTIFLLC